jgi:hypothetical protein
MPATALSFFSMNTLPPYLPRFVLQLLLALGSGLLIAALL